MRALDPVPELIITPLHEAAEQLGRVALPIIQELRPNALLVSHTNLYVSDPPRPGDEEMARAVDAIPDHSAIIILDDAFITGTRLTGYQKHMRDRAFSGRLHYLVAIARPASLEDWQFLQDKLSYRRSQDPKISNIRHTVQSIETVVVPNWSEQFCPWCSEIELYRSREAQTIEPMPDPTLRKRLSNLTNARNSGLSSGLFLTVPNSPPLEITRDSIFADAPCSQATIFAAVSAALQRLRKPDPSEDTLPLGPRRFPISTVLDDVEYLENTFTDSVLRACFLRAADHEELIYANNVTETKRAERARQLLVSSEQTQSNVAAEIILAARLGKFPGLNLNEDSVTSSLETLGLSLFNETLMEQM